MIDIDELAKTAYITYGHAVGWRNYRGEPMPDWTELGEGIRHAWAAAASAVVSAMSDDPDQPELG